MPVINLTVKLDQRKLLGGDLLSSFDDLSNGYNTTKFGKNDLAMGAVRTRHLVEPSGYDLFHRIWAPSGLSVDPLPYAIGPVNYYAILDTIFKFNLPHADLPNRFEPSAPVFNVEYVVRRVDETGAGTGPTRATIGFSINNATTWTPLRRAARPLDYTRGGRPQFFLPSPHYITGAGSTLPDSEPMDREVAFLASFGGVMSDGPATHANGVWVALMTNKVTDLPPMFINGKANARSTT